MTPTKRNSEGLADAYQWANWEAHIVLPLMLEHEGAADLVSKLHRMPLVVNAETLELKRHVCGLAWAVLISIDKQKSNPDVGMDSDFSIPKSVSGAASNPVHEEFRSRLVCARWCVEIGAHVGSPHELEITLVSRGWPGTYDELMAVCKATTQDAVIRQAEGTCCWGRNPDSAQNALGHLNRPE